VGCHALENGTHISGCQSSEPGLRCEAHLSLYHRNVPVTVRVALRERLQEPCLEERLFLLIDYSVVVQVTYPEQIHELCSHHSLSSEHLLEVWLEHATILGLFPWKFGIQG